MIFIEKSKTYNYYLELKLEKKTAQQLLNVYQRQMQNLIDSQGPKDAVSQSFSEGIKYTPTVVPVMNVYTEVSLLQEKINQKVEEVNELKQDLNIMKKNIKKISAKLNDNELVIFRLHWIKKVKLCDIVLLKKNGQPYDYRQIIRLNNKIKSKVKQNNL